MLLILIFVFISLSSKVNFVKSDVVAMSTNPDKETLFEQAMQREEKQLELLLEAVQSRLNDLKLSIAAMIQKLEIEHEAINWPTFLDNFALISSHLTGISKILSKDMGAAPLRNRTVLPLKVSQEHDEDLWKMTEGKIPVFSHDIVPDYLRTKPEPAAEQRMVQHEQKANSLLPETAIKHITQYTKIISHVYEMINKAREEWEIENNSRTGPAQTSSMTDTHMLCAAVGMGKNLKLQSMSGVPGGMMVPPAIRPMSVSPVGQMNKTPGPGIKTNIKAANQIHPFR